MYTSEESAQIQLWRQKCNNSTITQSELREALELLRRGRAGAHAASAASKTRKAASKTPVDSGKLLDQLDGL